MLALALALGTGSLLPTTGNPSAIGHTRAFSLEAPSSDLPRGTYVVVPIDNATPTEALPGLVAPKHRILYMNRHGGVFTPGMPDDSSHNVSSIPSRTSVVPPFSYGDAAWAEIMACITEIYAPYNITVTDVDPGDVAHIESVVGGAAEDVQLEPWYGGVAPGSAGCNVVERAVVYTFSEAYGNRPRAICETAAQESGHALGMDHELHCLDPMTYLADCGPKAFQDTDAECGEYEPRVCRCGGTKQNSAQHLLQVLGRPDREGPTAEILEPADGASVSPQFRVVATAADDVKLVSVELWVDGELRRTVVREPYEFVAPPDLSFGVHDVQVHAVDFGGNVAIDAISVTVLSECQTTSDCAEGEACDEGVCLTGLSGACALHEDCASGTCARNPEGKLACSTTCTAGDESSCPEGLACGASDGLCWPIEESGGGCATGGGVRSGAIAALVVSALLLVRRRRR